MSYKLTHPESDLTVEVEADMVAVYETQGWETAPTAKTPKGTE
jgi:hypothetical protein